MMLRPAQSAMPRGSPHADPQGVPSWQKPAQYSSPQIGYRYLVFRRLFSRKSRGSELVLLVARMNDRAMPLDRGELHSHSQGPTETALYMYGTSYEAMRAALAPLLESYPLCARARVVQVA